MQLFLGQRQRIGIAWALYKESDVLVLDEATSALDSETEKKVMESIGELGRHLTILMIAHRVTSLHGCEQIIRLENGQAQISHTFPNGLMTTPKEKKP